MIEEYLDIVNEKDEVVGKGLKSEKKTKGFISRLAVVFVKDSDGNIIICKRGDHKKNDPGLYDLSACGNVSAGETYKEAATRELLEETGIEGNLTMLDKFYLVNVHDGVDFKYFTTIFLCESNENPKLNEELVFFKKISIEELEKEIKENPEVFCHGFREDFIRVKEKLKFNLN